MHQREKSKLGWSADRCREGDCYIIRFLYKSVPTQILSTAINANLFAKILQPPSGNNEFVMTEDEAFSLNMTTLRYEPIQCSLTLRAPGGFL